MKQAVHCSVVRASHVSTAARVMEHRGLDISFRESSGCIGPKGGEECPAVLCVSIMYSRRLE